LVLIDEQPGEPGGDEAADGGAVAKDLQAAADHGLEVQVACIGEEPVVGLRGRHDLGVEAGDRFAGEQCAPAGNVTVFGPLWVFVEAGLVVGVHTQVELAGGVEHRVGGDRWVAGDASERCEDFGETEGVHGSAGDALASARVKDAQASPDFLGSLGPEGHARDPLRGLDFGAGQVRRLGHQQPGLTGAGPGQHDRVGSSKYRTSLRGVQAVDLLGKWSREQRWPPQRSGHDVGSAWSSASFCPWWSSRGRSRVRRLAWSSAWNR